MNELLSLPGLKKALSKAIQKSETDTQGMRLQQIEKILELVAKMMFANEWERAEIQDEIYAILA